MLKMKHLVILEKAVNLIMVFSIGFLCGMSYPKSPAIYWAIAIAICALAKIGLHHLGKKLKNLEE